MRVIWKYKLDRADDFQKRLMPQDWRIAHVEMQGGALTMWAEVDPQMPAREYGFRVFRTGHPIDPGYEYVGSCQDRAFVWHVYKLNRQWEPGNPVAEPTKSS